MESNRAGLRMYPRGFLGNNRINPQTERTQKPYSEQLNQLHYTVGQHSGVGSSLTPNPDVESIYSTLVKNDVKINDPKFRSSILKVALDAFGTDNFFTWFTSQYKSPAAGTIHNDFLVDTLKYISTGSRNMSLENWMALVYITDEGNSIGKPGDKVKEFFGVSQHSPIELANTNVKLVDVIQSWCSKSGGLEDLVCTLHILFGNL